MASNSPKMIFSLSTRDSSPVETAGLDVSSLIQGES